MISVNIKYKLSLLLFIFIIVFTFDRHERYEITTNPSLGPFEYDVGEYYSFLPKYFYGDEQSIANNFLNNKRTIGMAIMYFPAFIVGDVIARTTGERIDGYSPPYQSSVRWGSIIIVIFGLLICRQNLLRFFSDKVTLLTLVVIFFGTNLFYYTYCTGEMPHGYLFFLYSTFIYYCFKWLIDKKKNSIFILSIIASLIILIRPTDFLILLFPLLFKVNSFKELKERLIYLTSAKLNFFISVIIFLIPWLIQVYFWKKYNGNYFFYSYGKERFYFNDPQIFNFLLSFKKGWLIYTPIMVFSLIGIILSSKYFKQMFYFLLIFNILNIYILSSWWDWGYGGTFGNRALIQSYSILIFPLALFIKQISLVFKSKKMVNQILFLCGLIVLWFCIKLNLFQTWQSKYHIIHWSGMTKEAYKYVFLKETLTKQESEYLYKYLIKPPNSINMQNGIRD
ncbi:MAG: hypothetical protein LCH32_04245 [Bacteroidetes bacterium]|nr:hypothetical protein [Bacteroidota bacterium]